MKTQSRTNRFIACVTAICALAIATNVSAKNPKEVELNISDNKLIMKTKHNENDCEWTAFEIRKDGCIELAKNEKSDIYIHLKGDTKCTLESGTTWKLNAVYLGGFDSGSKPAGAFGFVNTSAANFDRVNKDFNGVNKTSGLVTPFEKKDKRITIKDNNDHKYNVWYKIEAICEREDGKPAHITSFDPRVKNGGME
jgi:hypothetical protein